VDQTVVLVPLLCVKCSTPIRAEPDQVAWVCAVCGQANYLDDEQGLQPLDIYYADSLAQNAVGKPYWVADGQVTLQRETFGSSKNNEAQQFWSQPRRFFIPAYRAPLEGLLSQATTFLLNPPRLQTGPTARFEPVTMAMQDITAAAEFIVVAIEAGRPDRLKKVDFQLKLSSPVLWILSA
jgi:hypothetical protein